MVIRKRGPGKVEGGGEGKKERGGAKGEGQ
jgi:hypothetical protein